MKRIALTLACLSFVFSAYSALPNGQGGNPALAQIFEGPNIDATRQALNTLKDRLGVSPDKMAEFTALILIDAERVVGIQDHIANAPLRNALVRTVVQEAMIKLELDLANLPAFGPVAQLDANLEQTAESIGTNIGENLGRLIIASGQNNNDHRYDDALLAVLSSLA